MRETYLLQESHLLRRTVIRLRTGVQGDRRKVQLGDTHVLNDQGIRPGLVKLPDHLLGLCQLLFFQDSVQGHVNTSRIEMGVIAKLPYIVQRITGGGTGSELRGTDIHGIGAMVNRLPAANQILSGR